MFHAYARGVPGQLVFLDQFDYEAFMTLLRRTERRAQWRLQAACLMPNHYHVLLEATVEALSTGMHRLNGIYAQRFNRRHLRYGHLFASRFGCRLIEGDEYYETVCAYVLDNPVRAGLCEEWSEWPWSFWVP
jgi:REP element-mobilizing transposase RayT